MTRDRDLRGVTSSPPISHVPQQFLRNGRYHAQVFTHGGLDMGKGNHSQKNDKKNKKPKQDKAKPAAKK